MRSARIVLSELIGFRVPRRPRARHVLERLRSDQPAMPGNHPDDREGCSLSCARHELIGSSVVYFARRMAMLDWTFATPSMTVITSQSQRWKLDRSAIFTRIR